MRYEPLSSKPVMAEAAEYIITEGVAGVWHYHLSTPDLPYRSLCNMVVMRTSAPLEYWNKTPKGYHLPETWCKTCERKRSSYDSDNDSSEVPEAQAKPPGKTT